MTFWFVLWSCVRFYLSVWSKIVITILNDSSWFKKKKQCMSSHTVLNSYRLLCMINVFGYSCTITNSIFEWKYSWSGFSIMFHFNVSHTLSILTELKFNSQHLANTQLNNLSLPKTKTKQVWPVWTTLDPFVFQCMVCRRK